MNNYNNQFKLFDFGINMNIVKLRDVKYEVLKKSGVYVAYDGSKMLKVGMTQDLNRRLSGYYGCNRKDCLLSRYINFENRDNIIFQWQGYEYNSCSDIETLLQKATEYNNIELPCWKRK